ncbi:peptide chain release factor H [Deminuibacter soli]|uniref:Peptide chain release factor H n=1 Tax=Deminuibacter soli TaxID=2291815 RepID=A0A3E1NEG8_9BACT|nr:peptide chain release factor H [Deminuibacter soli]RFM26370.1 peptide chain release factor H [Deminuibacter soli]
MHNSILIQVSAGRGPAECCRAVARLVPLLIKDADKQGITATVTEQTPGELNGTLQSVLLRLEGSAAAAFAASWEGSVQWVAQSPYRRMHKRKNWFVSLQVFKPAAQQVPPGTIVYTTCRASGPGGQHVNKTESAVWAIHVASGISVLASDTRSQHQNKKLATERLLQKLAAWQLEQQLASAQQQWEQHTHTQRGNAARVIRMPL